MTGKKRRAKPKGTTRSILAGETRDRTQPLIGSGTVEFIQAAQDGTSEGGRLPTVNILAYNGALMSVRWWGDVVLDLEGAVLPDQIMLLADHDDTLGGVVGHATAEIRDGKLYEQGVLSHGNPLTAQIVHLAQDGVRFEASVGTDPLKWEEVKSGEKVTVNGKTFTAVGFGLTVVRKWKLKETSILPFGADTQTTVDIAAKHAVTLSGGMDMKFEDWLKAKGIATEGLDDAVVETLRAAFEVETAEEPAKPSVKAAGHSTLDQITEATRKQQQRIAEITGVVATAITEQPERVEELRDLADAAIEAGEDPKNFELTLLRAMRPRMGGGRLRQRDDGMSDRVVEAAICMTGGLEAKELDAAFKPEELDAAHKRWPQGMGLQELLVTAARQHGYTGFSASNVDAVLRAAFTPVPQYLTAAGGGFSTLSLPGILSNTANKFLLKGFNAVENTWRSVAAVRSVRDFKQVSSYSLTGGFDYLEVGATGELKHASAGEETYTNQARTYGRLFAITRQDIINDDLGALSQVPQRLGRGAALKLNTVFWTAWLADNDTFYTAARGNFDDGADSAFDVDGVTAAELLFLNQTDPDGHPLGVTPRILLVPNALYTTANVLIASANLKGDTDEPEKNPHTGKFTVVRSSYLSDTTITGYSVTAWWLAADPADLPVIEVAFLNGKQRPTVESADADFNMLGIQMRGYHDFGVSKQEYRAAVKMAGV